MCGLVAILSRKEPVARETLERAIGRIAHRGPDGQGFYLASTEGGPSVGLAHARLAIIDLVTGAQPIANETDDVQVVVNGELYDHARIRRELEARGHRFRTRSDAEIVVHLWEELGPECLRELRGEFALVLWDSRRGRGTLFAARDRFGIKPLYFADAGDRLLLASEAKALFAAGLTARWDAQAFFESLVCQVPMLAEQTLFEGVRQLAPGHYLLATAEGVTTHPQCHRYWQPDFPHKRSEMPAAELDREVDELRAALDEAVRLRLVADVPVGVYLSGGIDSSVILALAARHSASKLRAFSIGFTRPAVGGRPPEPDPEVDELEVAARTAAHVGAELVGLRVSSDDLADHFADAVEHSEHAHDNPHGTAKYLLSRLVRDSGVKVVLGGEGADELFLGYPWLVLDLLKYDQKAEKPAAIASSIGPRAAGIVAGIQAVSQFAGGHPAMQAIRRTFGFIPSFLALSAAFFLRPELPAMMAAEPGGRNWRGTDPIARLLAGLDRGQLEGRDAATQAAYLQLRTHFASYNLNVLGDRMEMAHGVEGRVPFLDHHFFEAAKSIPATACFREGIDKWPLRALARGLVTEEVLRRPKWAFIAPDVIKDPGRLGQLVRDVLHGSALQSLPLYDPAAVRTALEKTSALPAVQSRLACAVVSACLLGERLGLTA